MEHTPADVVRQLLIDLTLATDPDVAGAWPAYADDEPDKPDDCITVYTTSGQSFGDDHTSGEVLGNFGVQFRVRSMDKKLGWRKANAIATAIAETVYQARVTVPDPETDYFIQCFGGIGDVLPIGREVGKSRRHLCTINANVQIKEV